MTRQTLPDLRLGVIGSRFLPSFQKAMCRLLDQFRAGFLVPGMGADTPFPPIDVVEAGDRIEITAEVPCVTEERLPLQGCKSRDSDHVEVNYHVVERTYGSFRRQIPLGFTPEEGAIKTSFADGILKLSIAKPPEATTDVQKIKIKKT